VNRAVKDKTEAAYRRGDLLDKRRELMLNWEQFVTSRPLRSRRKNDPATREDS